MCKLCNSDNEPYPIYNRMSKMKTVLMFLRVLNDYTGERPCTKCYRSFYASQAKNKDIDIDSYIIEKLFKANMPSGKRNKANAFRRYHFGTGHYLEQSKERNKTYQKKIHRKTISRGIMKKTTPANISYVVQIFISHDNKITKTFKEYKDALQYQQVKELEYGISGGKPRPKRTITKRKRVEKNIEEAFYGKTYTYRVISMVNNKRHYHKFKTLQEAIKYRDRQSNTKQL